MSFFCGFKIISNNRVGGDFIQSTNNKVFFFWKIGKYAYENQNNYDNIIEKLSVFCSYQFGDSRLYSRENIHMMRRFYLSFPVFYKKLMSFSWEQFKLLLMISDKKERYFYFYLSLLFKSNYQGTLEFILNDYYMRIW